MLGRDVEVADLHDVAPGRLAESPHEDEGPEHGE